MKTVHYLVNEQRYIVKSQIIGTELWLHINGETHIVDLRPKSTVKSQGGSEVVSGVIYAPMPGKILKVNFSLDDKVQSQTVIIIMEAMKMEYSLAAPFSGKIKEISCREGQQVELNQKLASVVAVRESDERKN